MARRDGRPARARAPRRRHRLGKDEHLVPGRGTQPCVRVAGVPGPQRLRRHGRASRSTRAGSTDREEREADLAEALAFARLHLAAPRVESGAWRAGPSRRGRAASGRPAAAAADERHPGEILEAARTEFAGERVRRRVGPRHRARGRRGPGAGAPLLRREGAGVRRGDASFPLDPADLVIPRSSARVRDGVGERLVRSFLRSGTSPGAGHADARRAAVRDDQRARPPRCCGSS